MCHTPWHIFVWKLLHKWSLIGRLIIVSPSCLFRPWMLWHQLELPLEELQTRQFQLKCWTVTPLHKWRRNSWNKRGRGPHIHRGRTSTHYTSVCTARQVYILILNFFCLFFLLDSKTHSWNYGTKNLCETVKRMHESHRLPLVVMIYGHSFPASTEWRAGVAGHLILSDEDLTSVVQGSWKRLNTLQHYKVSKSPADLL